VREHLHAVLAHLADGGNENVEGPQEFALLFFIYLFSINIFYCGNEDVERHARVRAVARNRASDYIHNRTRTSICNTQIYTCIYI
jgi:hypothetical protein